MPMCFADALESGSLAQVPKSGLHSHAGRGGSQAYIGQRAGVAITPPDGPFADLGAMQAWFETHVKAFCPPGLEGYLLRLEAAFAQAAQDGIAVLALGFGADEVRALGGMEPFCGVVDGLRARFAPDTRFLPELCFDRAGDPDAALDGIDALLAPGWFASIDLCGDELAQPIGRFRTLYHAAGRYPVWRRAHVGEFGTAEDVVEAVDTLGLDEVHHGIAAAASPRAMRRLADAGIRLNVCPTSNILLGRAADYRTHPIVALVEHGVPVTINTDDLLILGSSVSDEYARLWRAGALDADALEAIRLAGLAWARKGEMTS